MRNRLSIHQQQRLEQAAYEMTALRAATIELGPLVRGLPHLRTSIASCIRIFSTAGQLCEVDIYQADTPFCQFAYIEKEGNALMQDLEEEGYLVGPEKAKLSSGWRITIVKSTCCIPPGGSGLAHRSSSRTGDSCGYQLSWQGIEKEARIRQSEWGNGGSHRLQMIFSKVVSEAGESE
ncbi:putative adenosine monophosphate-protein transferase Fic [Escherichia coli]